MKHRILIVIHNCEMRDFILDILEEQFKDSSAIIEIDKEETYQDAVGKCGDSNPYSLVISQLHIPWHRKAPLVEKDMLGLELFRKLSDKSEVVPGILLTPYMEKNLEAQIKKLPGICLVLEGDRWEERIGEFVGQALDGLATDELKAASFCTKRIKSHKKVRLEVSIYPYEGTWQIHFVGCGGVLCNPKPYILHVNPTEINSIRQKVNRLDEKLDNDDIEYSDWKETLSEIGKHLVQEILRNNLEILQYYCRLRGEVGGCEHFSIRFSTSEEAYPLLLEAILVPDSRAKDDFWMLKAPICRHVDMGDPELWPLFEDPESDDLIQKINCLIIEADVHGWDEKLGVTLDKLEKISEESSQLEDKLNSLRNECYVERLSGQDCTEEKVHKKLTNGTQWHLVHYVGHSLHRDKGYVFFLKNGMPDPVSIQFFSRWLRLARTRLIYLSGCQSCKIEFVRELAQNGLPSALGFRWKIDDKEAAEYAGIFYDNLFKERSLEDAFLKTRQKVWETYSEHKIWAAPVLMMQAHR